MKKLAFLFVMAVVFASCGSSTAPKQEEVVAEEVIIEQAPVVVDSAAVVVDSVVVE